MRLRNHLLLLLFLLVRNAVFGQIAVIADPALATGSINTVFNQLANPLEMPKGQLFILKIPVFNYHAINALPAGSCKLKIGLGSKLTLQNGFNISSLAYNNYFQWTAENSGGQVFITGNLTNSMPAVFSGNVEVPVIGLLTGLSTITANFLVTNHNNTVLLSDENGTNNGFLFQYIVTDPTLPVKFTYMNAIFAECRLGVRFGGENEINVRHYEIEISADLIHFVKVGQLPADGRIHYQFRTEVPDSLKKPSIAVRVKSVDFNGATGFSNVVSISSICKAAPDILLVHPNPVKAGSLISLRFGNGSMNGLYKIQFFDAAGKLVDEVSQRAVSGEVKYTIHSRLAQGGYFIKVFETAGVRAAYVQSLLLVK